jgi:WD40 repeat protein
VWDLVAEAPAAKSLDLKGLEVARCSRFSLTPDSTRLIATMENGNTELWNLGTKTREASWRPIRHNYGSWEDLISADNKTQVSIESRNRRSDNLATEVGEYLNWASDFGWNQYGPPTYTVVRHLPSGQVRAALTGEYRPTLSSDGKVLATVNPEGTATLWDLSKP